MRVMHLFSSKTYAGLERHVEELAYAQTEKHDVQVIGPANFKERFRANYKIIDTNQWRLSPILSFQIKRQSMTFNQILFILMPIKLQQLFPSLRIRDFNT